MRVVEQLVHTSYRVDKTGQCTNTSNRIGGGTRTLAIGLQNDIAVTLVKPANVLFRNTLDLELLNSPRLS